jgi:hypothetical protein
MRLPLCILALAVSAWAADVDVPQPDAAPDQAQAAPPAQTPAPAAAATPAPAAPMPLPTPSITGPLANLPPAIFDAGPFGKLSVNGFLSGIAVGQSNHVPGDNIFQADLSNAQVFIQKTDGWFQFYVQAGAYNIPDLGVPNLKTSKTLSAFWGPVPVAYAKFQAGKNTSIEIGSLPTLIGAEYTFTFENMNVERGLLWNQENAINRGIQLNQTMGKFTASFSWNDGFYSNRYTWLSGSLAYTNGPHALSFVAGGNYGKTGYETFATPVQNNSTIYNVIYTYSKGAWILQPYYQHTDVPTNLAIGIVKGASTDGGAVLVSRAFSHGFALPLRVEYITSSGTAAQNAVNLMFGSGSSGTSVTVTPTFQYGGFFFRTDLAWVHASDYTPGDVFGPKGLNDNQFRAAAEMGFVFGNNIMEKK